MKEHDSTYRLTIFQYKLKVSNLHNGLNRKTTNNIRLNIYVHRTILTL